MDLDAVLERHPQVVLVDELAHTNVPGSGRNEKRWQDVIELLDAGIDVDHHRQHPAPGEHRRRGRTDHRGARSASGCPTGCSGRPTRSSWSTPPPSSSAAGCCTATSTRAERFPQALAHYFRTDNLTALRELALRFLADETEDQLLEYLRRHQKDVVWETHERILVGVTTAPGTDAIVRRACLSCASMCRSIRPLVSKPFNNCVTVGEVTRSILLISETLISLAPGLQPFLNRTIL